MNEIEMKNRTKQFALRVLKMTEAVPANRTGNAIANQLVRCGTSVAANYRALCRADFINKTNIVEEEADETGFWLELVVDAGLLSTARVQPLLAEADEITGILVASRKTAIARGR